MFVLSLVSHISIYFGSFLKYVFLIPIFLVDIHSVYIIRHIYHLGRS